MQASSGREFTPFGANVCEGSKDMIGSESTMNRYHDSGSWIRNWVTKTGFSNTGFRYEKVMLVVSPSLAQIAQAQTVENPGELPPARTWICRVDLNGIHVT